MEKFETENDLRLTIKADEKEVLVDEDCCTTVNIILKNDGQIMTSFLGAHNPEIVKILERTLKAYFKGIKKTLKATYKEPDNCCCGDESCHGECHANDCDCHDHHDHKCDCHDHDKNTVEKTSKTKTKTKDSCNKDGEVKKTKSQTKTSTSAKKTTKTSK